MTAVIDHDLDQLRGLAAELASDLRPLAIELDVDPDALYKRPDLPVIDAMSTFGIPQDYNPAPLRVGGRAFYGTRTVELTTVMEEIAAADVVAIFAMPGPALSGIPVRDLGSAQQQERYFARLLERPVCTFFALTEPAHGSSAADLDTGLVPRPDGGGMVLRGVKRYVSNGARAELGVSFARTAPGPLGIVAVLIDTSAAGFSATPLATIGLRGALLSELRFDDVEIASEQVLGMHLPATRRGMLGLVRMFNRSRPMVAAMGLGMARAAIDYVHAHRRTLRHAERDVLDDLSRKLAITRCLVHEAALAVDKDPDLGARASAAKARSGQLVEYATRMAPRFFGPGGRLEHPMLDKLARDARGFEFMEGTTNMQKLNVFQGYRLCTFDAACHRAAD